MTDLADIAREFWTMRIGRQYLYRGMSLTNLTYPLNPLKNPFSAALPMIQEFLCVLQRLVDKGFAFTLIEKHWDKIYRHELRNIVAWSKNDLRNPNIAFTSRYESAREYADNWQGSQIKQNLKYISDHLPAYRKNPVITSEMNAQDWDLVARVGEWAGQQVPGHQGIVLWVRRSSNAFRTNAEFPLVGQRESFQNWLLDAVKTKGLPLSREVIAQLLPPEPDEFYAYLTRPLVQNEIERIEQISYE